MEGQASNAEPRRVLSWRSLEPTAGANAADARDGACQWHNVENRPWPFTFDKLPRCTSSPPATPARLRFLSCSGNRSSQLGGPRRARYVRNCLCGARTSPILPRRRAPLTTADRSSGARDMRADGLRLLPRASPAHFCPEPFLALGGRRGRRPAEKKLCAQTTGRLRDCWRAPLALAARRASFARLAATRR